MTKEGKVYSIGLKGMANSYTVMHLHSDHFHGVHCLKGIACSPSHHWIEGKHVYIPVAEIAAITEYDTWNDFLAAGKLANGDGEKTAASPQTRTKPKKVAKAKKRR